METLQLEINRARTAVKTAKNAIALLEGELITLIKEIESRRKELEQFLADESALPVKIKKEKENLASLKIAIIGSETVVQQLLNIWVAQGRKLPKPVNLKTAETNLEAKKKERDALEKKISDLEKKLANIPALKKKANDDIKKFESAKSDATAKLDAAKADLALLEKEYKQLTDAQKQQIEEAMGAMPVADLPVALLPVHLQTRYHLEGDQPELLIRIYPDALYIDTHEPELTEAELNYGKNYWDRLWRIGKGQDEEAELQRQNVWAQLCQRFTPRRAAWIVKTLAPLNPGAQPETAIAENKPLSSPIQFPNPEKRASSWTRAPKVTFSPHRWVASAYRGGERVLLAWGNPVAKNIHMGPNPKAPMPLPDTLSAEQVAIDEGMRWLIDFQEAEREGMAIRARLSPEEARIPLDTLVVFGMANELDGAAGARKLEDLLNAHHYTGGLAFVPQGTPTNNMEESGSGFSSDDPGFIRSFDTECKPPLFDAGYACNGTLLAETMGLSPAIFQHIQHAQGKERQEARFMRTALWPVTWGYFLEQMVGNDKITPEVIRQVRKHYIDFVSGGGLLPAIRVGKQPYGILPVTALNRWKPETETELPAHLIALMQAPPDNRQEAISLRQIWKNALANVSKATTEEVGGQRLLEILSLNAISGQFTAKTMIDRALLQDAAVPASLKPPVLSAQELTERIKRAEKLLDRLGIKGRHRLLDMAYSLATLSLNAPLTSDGSKEEPLQPGYINWLRTANIQALIKESGLETKPDMLFYLLLRHAALLAYSNAIFQKLMSEGKIKWENRLEPSTVSNKAPATPTLGRYLLNNANVLAKEEDHPAELKEFRDSLQGLENLSVARLEDLFRETMDISAHRLDAWATSLAGRRLFEMRKQQPTGILLGGFGWVENLSPSPTPVSVDTAIAGESGSPVFAGLEKGGFIHAPSLDHAATAAILRSGYLAQNKDRNSSQFAIDLSSERARLAQALLEGVRQGQTLSALLGYRFERGLHERRLDHFIESFRLLAPLGSVYKIMADVESTRQKITELEKWKSPELKAAEANFGKFSEMITRFTKWYKDFYHNKLSSKEFDVIFREIAVLDAQISMLGKILADGDFTEKGKEDMEREIARLNAIKGKWLIQLKTKIDDLNNRAKDFKKLHNELVDYLYKYPAGKGPVKVKVNFPPSNSIAKLNWNQPIISQNTIQVVRAAIETINNGQPSLLASRLPEAVKEFKVYIKDLSLKSHPALSSTLAQLEQLETALEQAKQSFNDQYLLPADSDMGAMETIPAQNVVDGLALLRLWREQDIKPVIPFGGQVGTKQVKLPKSGEQYDGLEAELNALSDAMDAVSDSIVAESVYQTVKGNAVKASASLDAIGRGELPPAELEFLRSPRGGTNLTHRFFLLLNDKSTNTEWPTAASQVRAKIEPALNAWAARLLGNPNQILIQAEYLHPESKIVLANSLVRLSELQLSALDFIYLSNREPFPLQLELEQRILYHLHRSMPQDIPPDATVQLFFERGNDWLPNQFSLTEMLEAGRAIREVIVKASPLQPHHLKRQGSTDSSAFDASELQERVNTIVNNFNNAQNKLSQLSGNPQAPPEEIRSVLMTFAGFGMPGAVPVSVVGNTAEDRRSLLEQSRAILTEANRRLTEAQGMLSTISPENSESHKLEVYSNCIQTLLHSDFQLLPLFRLPKEGDVVQSFSQSEKLQNNDPYAVCAWLERTARVREAVADMNDAIGYSQALLQKYENHCKVGQLPHLQGDRWAALPCEAGKEVRPGTISLVSNMPWGIDASARQSGLLIDEWTEIIPKQKQMTGLAFQFENPGARAPQSILLAAPPKETERWDIELIESILMETNEWCKLRAVDLEALSRNEKEQDVSQFLPAVYLSLNPEGDTISTDPLRAFLPPRIE